MTVASTSHKHGRYVLRLVRPPISNKDFKIKLYAGDFLNQCKNHLKLTCSPDTPASHTSYFAMGAETMTTRGSEGVARALAIAL
jgi:hypothetical protein